MDVLSCGFCAAVLPCDVAKAAHNDNNDNIDNSSSSSHADDDSDVVAHTHAVQTRWPRPTLQIVDIQRYPRAATATTTTTSRFYLAASDGQSLVWLVVPPATATEAAVADYDVDVGSCVTLHAYALATAANRRRVVVVLQLTASSHTLSLLGAPRMDVSLFALSSHALLPQSKQQQQQQQGAMRADTHAQGDKDTSSCGPPIALRDLLDSPERALRPWCVLLRIVWRGKERRVDYARGQPHAPRPPPHNMTTTTATAAAAAVVSVANDVTVELHCIGVDVYGDAMPCVLRGSASSFTQWAEYDCLLLQHGSVGWGGGEAGLAALLRFADSSHGVVVVQRDSAARTSATATATTTQPPLSPSPSALSATPPQAAAAQHDEDADDSNHTLAAMAANIPRYPRRLVGAAALSLVRVHSVCTEAVVDETVSLIARVRSSGPPVHVHTKRGRVLRRTVTLEDVALSPRHALSSSSSSAAAAMVVELTLWDELADAVAPMSGEVWCFLSCAVREYAQRKTLSSRGTTACFCMDASAVTAALSSPSVVRTHEGQRQCDAANDDDDTQRALLYPTQHRDADDAAGLAVLANDDDNNNNNNDGDDDDCTQLVLTLAEATPALPVLVRIQRMTLLSPHEQQQQQLVLSEGGVCARLVLSDGVDAVEACASAPVCEALLDSSVHDTCAALVGVVVLAWLSQTSPCVLTRCQHVNLSACAYALHAAITAALGDT